jgi:formiminotetrahydrofolate cyclodeaminase
MPSYSGFSVRELLDAFASATPAPGGGSAAALAGAIGASLLLMAVGVRRSRSNGADESRELAESAARLQALQPVMAQLIDRDADAYAAVISARRLPAGDEESKSRQRLAVASAMRVATDAPLETMRACRRALQAAPVIADHCTRSARADVGVAIELLRAAVRGAGRTVAANLASLEDAEYADSVRTERETLESESAADAEHGLAQLSGRPA